jgi:hypothetical protein
LADVADAPLFTVPRVLDALRAYRARPKFGGDPAAAQLSAMLDGLVDVLLARLEAHPTRFWVLQQLRKMLAQLADAGAGAGRQGAGSADGHPRHPSGRPAGMGSALAAASDHTASASASDAALQYFHTSIQLLVHVGVVLLQFDYRLRRPDRDVGRSILAS